MLFHLGGKVEQAGGKGGLSILEKEEEKYHFSGQLFCLRSGEATFKNFSRQKGEIKVSSSVGQLFGKNLSGYFPLS